jgi:hypothetical protein
MASLVNMNNYTILLKRGLIGSNALIPVKTLPAIAGFYSDAMTATLQFRMPLPVGQYLFQVKSGGVFDNAGNPLDGEFTGRLPSGDGRPGGNFIVSITVPPKRILKVHKSKSTQMRRPHHQS